MRMHFTLTSFPAIVYLLTNVSLLEANNSTSHELARSESLRFAHVRTRDAHSQQSNGIKYLASARRKVPVFINSNVGLAGNKGLQFLNSVIYGGKTVPVINKHSSPSLSDVMSNYRVKSYITNISPPKILSREKRAHHRKRVQTREAPVHDYTSTSDDNDGRMKNTSIVTEDEHNYRGASRVTEYEHNYRGASRVTEDEHNYRGASRVTEDEHNYRGASHVTEDEHNYRGPSHVAEDEHNYRGASHVTEDEHNYRGASHVAEPRGNNTLKYKTETLLTSSTAKAGSYIRGKRVNRPVSKCACDNTTCAFSHCNLTSVPQDLTPNVTILLLSYNNIYFLPSNGFLRYKFLEMVDLSYNEISILEDGAFNGLSRLTSLNLVATSLGTITDIPDRIFEPLESLKALQLYLNDFPCDNSPPFQDRFLAYLPNLEELYTDNYGNQDYGPGFNNMTSLRNLSFVCLCSIHRLSNTTFINLQQITLLNISGCNIGGQVIDVGAFVHLRNLEILDISDNKPLGMEYLPVILRGLNNSNLQVLVMDTIVSDDSINFINSSITLQLPRTLAVLSARNNNIMSLDRNAFLDLPSSLRYVDLTDNFMRVQAVYFPWAMLTELEVLLVNTDLKECLSNDPHMLDLPQRDASGIHQLTRFTNRQTREHKKAAKSSLLKIPGKLKRIQINVRSMHETFLFNLDRNNSLEEIDLRCSILSDFNFIDLVNFPKLRYLNIGRSSIRKFSIPTEQEIPPIKVLIMESNRLNDFLDTSESPFRGLNNLSYLDLSLNEISSLKKDLFNGLDNLEHLRLDGNTFSYFGANISSMEQLKMLNVSNTGLSYLPNQVRSHIDHLCQTRPVQITIDMSGCPIQCDCLNLDFLNWMVKSSAFDKNFTGYVCRYPDASFKYMPDGYKETAHRLDRECAKNYPMFLAVVAVTLILLFTVTGIIIYRFRWKIRYLYYAAYLKVMDANRKEKEHAFKYDVFISFDSEDQGFVTRYLGPELEDRGLKLLIHTRDFVAGTYITSNIVMAVAESRKTLVVLTRNLVESTWCNYEIQMATMEAVHTGRQVLVFLLKDDIPSRELDVELLRYIKTNTYLPYPGPGDEGDEEIMKRFYDKLAHDLKC